MSREKTEERHALTTRASNNCRSSPVVLLGYPIGVDAILARTGAATLQAIEASSKGAVISVISAARP